jgi:hypothetical protein
MATFRRMAGERKHQEARGEGAPGLLHLTVAILACLPPANPRDGSGVALEGLSGEGYDGRFDGQVLDVGRNPLYRRVA